MIFYENMSYMPKMETLLCVCVCVAYGAKDLPYVGSSRQFSINLQRLCQDSAGETQQKQGNTAHAASHIPQRIHTFPLMHCRLAQHQMVGCMKRN